MARVLVVQHAASEGLGRFADWLPAAGVDVHPIHPYLGHRVPTSVEGDALIVLGGPMAASDDASTGWLPAVRALLVTAVEDGVPTLGVCLGAQLLAVATGGEVARGHNGAEHGLSEVDVPAGDDVFEPGRLPVVQWHQDTVTRLPDGAALLASNAVYPVQAFRVGDLAWGLQFHVEATDEMVRTWARDDGIGEAVVDAVAGARPGLDAAGERLARRFAALVTG